MVSASVSPKYVVALLLVVVVFQSFMLLPKSENESTSFFNELEQSRFPRGLYANRTLMFVHVGKTGGETIKWRLSVICQQRASKRKRARCFEQFAGSESQLSKKTIGYMHCGAMRPRQSILNATSFLVSIRDPIDRIVSWFQFMHPKNCLLERPSAACNLKKDGADTWGPLFYKCFDDVGDMVRSVAYNHDNCSQMAVDAVRGRAPEAASNHMYFNYFFNANKTIFPYPRKDIFVVRQEFLWEDLRRIEGLLGGNPSRAFETDGPIVTHGSELFPYKGVLSPHLIPVLCCAIPNEIAVYIKLIQRAVNVYDKHSPVEKLVEKCGASSFPQLVEKCHWGPLPFG
jgi:hypothetical protein